MKNQTKICCMKDRETKITCVTTLGAVGNLGLAVFKAMAGLWGHSSAMLADAVHSLSDLVSDIVVLVMVRVSSQGVDRNHAYGHGKFETLATAIVALLLLLVGGELMADGVTKIHDVLCGNDLPMPNSLALWAAVVSIVVKEALYWWTYMVGKRVNSPAMITNAWHHRTDALSSVGALVGIGGAMWLGGRWVILDPIVGCVISIVIIVVAVKMAMPALYELTEGALPEEEARQIKSIIASVPGVKNVHQLKTRKNGPSVILSAHVVVDPQMTVEDAHRITELAEEAVRAEFGRETQISIHVEPSRKAK